jgi:hypothetical protein
MAMPPATNKLDRTVAKASRNGHLTVQALAGQKQLPLDLLTGLGLKDLPGGGVGIPFFGPSGEHLFTREREVPSRDKRFWQPPGVPLRPYGLNWLADARAPKCLILAEGETDALTCRHYNLLALGLPGANSFGCLRAEDIDGVDTVFVHQECGEDGEPDTGGKQFAPGVARQLAKLGFRGRAYAIRCRDVRVKDISDLHVQCKDRAEFRDRWQKVTQGARQLPLSGESPKPGSPKPGAGLATTCLATIRPKPVRYLVPGKVPLGKLVLLAGDGGHGKSSVTLDLAACVSTGRPCTGLDYADAVAGEVLLVSCEDDYADTVVPRLLSAGADLTKIHRVDGVRGPDGKPQPFNAAHFKALQQELEKRPAVRLVVIDPAGSYIGRAGVDENKDADLRSLLDPLAEVAARCHVTIVLIKHLNKSATMKAVYRVCGGVAYGNAVRMSYLVAPSEDDDDLKLLLPLKTNLGRKPVGMSYRMVALEPWHREAVLDLCPDLEGDDREALGEQLYRVVWKGEVATDADALMAEARRRERGPSKVDRAVQWLQGFLNGYAWPDAEVVVAARAAGFTFDNYKEAKGRLRPGLVSTNVGRFGGTWWVGMGQPDTWKLRPVTQQTPQTPHNGNSRGFSQSGEDKGPFRSAPQTPHNGEGIAQSGEGSVHCGESAPHNGAGPEKQVNAPLSGEWGVCGDSGESCATSAQGCPTPFDEDQRC